MARDDGTVVIEGGAVAATRENAVLCCGASVTCAGLLVQRVTWPAAAVTRGLLVVEGCDFEDTKIALLARGEESALEARGCSAERVDYGA